MWSPATSDVQEHLVQNPERLNSAARNARGEVARRNLGSFQRSWGQIEAARPRDPDVGTKIEWLSTAPNGDYCVLLKDESLLTNRDDLVSAIQQQQQRDPDTCVEHVSFSHQGAWLMRFSDDTIQLSRQGSFPDTFYSDLGPYLDLSTVAPYDRQVSVIKNAWFGYNDSVIIQTERKILWVNLSDNLEKLLTQIETNGYSLGRGTTLCPYNSDRFFFEVLALHTEEPQYPFSVSETQFSSEFLMEVVRNRRPSLQTIQQLPSHATSNEADPPSGAERSGTPPPPYPGSAQTQPSTDATPSIQEEGLDPGASATEIPEAAKQEYKSQFAKHASGKPYLSGMMAAVIFMETGASQDFLDRIWDETDADQNGRFDEAEFVNAMWLIKLHLATTILVETDRRHQHGSTAVATGVQAASVKELETDMQCTCDACGQLIKYDSFLYHCPVCNGGNLDYCEVCYSGGNRCPHGMEKGIIRPADVQDYLVFDEVPCDLCGYPCGFGSYMFQCGQFDDYGESRQICEECLGHYGGDCGHKQQILRITDAFSSTRPEATGSQSAFVSQQRKPANIIDISWEQESNNVPEYPWNHEPDDQDKPSRKFQDMKLRESLMSSIVSEKPNVKWEDVAGLESAKTELQEAIIFPLRFPQMFKGKRKARRAILLYGPPGTGKSYLAKAIATEVEYTLFRISSSDVMSKWYGESETLVRQLFKLAREKKPSIIFIDEIDAICANREGGANGGNEDTARMKTEFLVQMDGVGNDNEGVLILAATNLPWSLDPAVRRRFQKRIHIPLPDENARRALFKIHSGELCQGFTEQKFAELSRRTDGFSGSDIANIVQDALMVPVKKVHSATHFRRLPASKGAWFTPCSPYEPGAMPMTWKQVPADQVKEPSITAEDVFQCLGDGKSSVAPEELTKYTQWTQQYGSEGA